jgi:hypothetical protein
MVVLWFIVEPTATNNAAAGSTQFRKDQREYFSVSSPSERRPQGSSDS